MSSVYKVVSKIGCSWTYWRPNATNTHSECVTLITFFKATLARQKNALQPSVLCTLLVSFYFSLFPSVIDHKKCFEFFSFMGKIHEMLEFSCQNTM